MGRGRLRGVALRGDCPFMICGRGPSRALPLRWRGPYMGVIFHMLGLSDPYLDERGLHGLDLFPGKTCNGMVY